jgi:hypothetical protein
MPGIDDLGGFGKSANRSKTQQPDRQNQRTATPKPDPAENRSLPADVQQAMLRSMQGEPDRDVMKFRYNDLIRGALSGCEKALDIRGDSQVMRIAILHLHKTLTGEWPQPVSRKKLGRWL